MLVSSCMCVRLLYEGSKLFIFVSHFVSDKTFSAAAPLPETSDKCSLVNQFKKEKKGEKYCCHSNSCNGKYINKSCYK